MSRKIIDLVLPESCSRANTEVRYEVHYLPEHRKTYGDMGPTALDWRVQSFTEQKWALDFINQLEHSGLDWYVHQLFVTGFMLLPRVTEDRNYR